MVCCVSKVPLLLLSDDDGDRIRLVKVMMTVMLAGTA